MRSSTSAPCRARQAGNCAPRSPGAPLLCGWRAARRARQAPRAVEVVAELAALVQTATNTIAAAAGPLEPVVQTVGGDVASVLDLQPTLPGVARLSALFYLLGTRPNPFAGMLDFFVLGPATAASAPKLSARDFVLRDKLGGGNFGVTYEAVKIKAGESVSQRSQLSPEQKQRRVVLKRVNIDRAGGIRQDFLRTGTMAKGAAETGAVETYMCAKVKRNPLVASNCAEYLGDFVADESFGNIMQRGTQWLVWRFESDSTLADGLDGLLGKFPESLEALVMGRVDEGGDPEKREAEVIKRILKQVLVAVKGLHSMGIVHRDIKPDNLLITVDGKVKVIDFGAAADMCTGINFNPLYGMLDPRYSPPEELIMPQNFPRAPSPFVAALLSPLAWAYGRPDLFDSYSSGVLLVQMAVPQLRSSASIRLFNSQLRSFDYDLEAWRRGPGRSYDFTQLDRQGGAGWDLAQRLLAKRDKYNRGRLDAGAALRHRYFGGSLFG
ncbi:MAG: protein kinase [Monoraphidium minutum]|nr:MAG: protein kinase [Monoraphidium minutum]